MKKWYQKIWGKILIFFIVLIIICLAIFGIYVLKLAHEMTQKQLIANTQESQAAQKTKTLAMGDGSNYSLGSSNPTITIIEFSDFGCEYCRQAAFKIGQLIRSHPEIKIIFRNMPILEGSDELAMAGLCAGEQGRFWQMHDKLFEKQGQLQAGQDLVDIVNSLNMDYSKFKDCFTNKKYTEKIKKDQTDGLALGIGATPAWLINGYKVEGDIPMEGWESILKKFKE